MGLEVVDTEYIYCILFIFVFVCQLMIFPYSRGVVNREATITTMRKRLHQHNESTTSALPSCTSKQKEDNELLRNWETGTTELVDRKVATSAALATI